MVLPSPGKRAGDGSTILKVLQCAIDGSHNLHTITDKIQMTGITDKLIFSETKPVLHNIKESLAIGLYPLEEPVRHRPILTKLQRSGRLLNHVASKGFYIYKAFDESLSLKEYLNSMKESGTFSTKERTRLERAFMTQLWWLHSQGLLLSEELLQIDQSSIEAFLSKFAVGFVQRKDAVQELVVHLKDLSSDARLIHFQLDLSAKGYIESLEERLESLKSDLLPNSWPNTITRLTESLDKELFPQIQALAETRLRVKQFFHTVIKSKIAPDQASEFNVWLREYLGPFLETELPSKRDLQRLRGAFRSHWLPDLDPTLDSDLNAVLLKIKTLSRNVGDLRTEFLRLVRDSSNDSIVVVQARKWFDGLLYGDWKLLANLKALKSDQEKRALQVFHRALEWSMSTPIGWPLR